MKERFPTSRAPQRRCCWLLLLLGGPLLAGPGGALAQGASLESQTPLGSATFQPSPLRPVGWRGDGTGKYLAADSVGKWSANENVLWKSEIGAGQSSPIVVGGRLFVTAEPDVLICLDTETGRQLWRKSHKLADLSAEAAARGARHSSQYGDATPTPVSDGERVWVFFGTGIVASYDLEGKRHWMNWYDQRQATSYGRTASPVLVANRLLVHFGPLVCLGAETGKLRWQNDQVKATYGTPAATRLGEVDVVIAPKGQVVRVADGKVLATDLGNCMYTSPVVQDNIVYFIDGAMSAVRLPEKAADQIECKELWFAELSGEFFASPVVHDGRVYTVGKAAKYYVIEASTGKIVLNQKLELAPATDAGNASIYPSLTLAGRRLMVGNDVGETILLELGDQGAVAGSGALPGGSGATPIFSGRRMFVRGGKFLYCVAAP